MSSLPHDSAHTHVTGESEYVDDRSPTQGELFLDVVYSPHAHARIKRVDCKKALEYPGVRGAFTAKDFHHNLWGTIFQDQPLLADDIVRFVGEPIVIIAAESRETARAARDLVRVDYTVLPAILSIEEARQAESWIGHERSIQRGSPSDAIAQAPHCIEGRIVIRGADHFYLESNVALAYPKEDGQLEIHSSSQHPTEVQHVVAHGLGIPSRDVTSIVKRMGGAFGGKESQAAPFAAFAALVAHKLKRPARIVLTKDDDMIMTGKRNPFENEYRVGFDDQGRILGLEIKLFSDGGAYADLSTSIMERAMLHCDNAYYIPNFKVTGRVCRTHFHPHTAFRGFGGPKGVATIEKIIEEIAHRLGIDALDVRKRNVYEDKDGRNITPYLQTVENNCLPELFEKLERESDYRSRRLEIERHNREALEGKHSTLRGLSLTAVKFGISFTTRFLNQANALVLIHRDGTIQASTGATEMGQGVNARIATIIAEELGLSRESVRMMPTTTDKNANTSPTAASSGTDLNGAAAVLATRKIKARLSELALRLLDIPEERWARKTAGLGTEPEIEVMGLAREVRDANEGADWVTGVATYHGITFRGGKVFHESRPTRTIGFAELVHEAYHQRVSLSDYAHYKFPLLSFNKLTGQGRAFLYFTQGVGTNEVSIDRFTGELKVLRTDLLMDLGRPINEALDIGQVTGAYVQGMGWVTTEKLHYSAGGKLLSHSPSTYKIPSIQDTPRIFNTTLLSNDGNKVNIRGTKAVGEPPLLLAIGVWTAAHDALKGLPEYSGAFPQMELPSTQEELLRALMPGEFKRRQSK